MLSASNIAKNQRNRTRSGRVMKARSARSVIARHGSALSAR
jgi:hypothetical protein